MPLLVQKKKYKQLALFDGCSISLLKTLQRFSVGFRSGECAGHDIVLMWFSNIHTLMDLAVWHRALFSWTNQSSDLGKEEQKEASFYQHNLVFGLLHAEAPPNHD